MYDSLFLNVISYDAEEFSLSIFRPVWFLQAKIMEKKNVEKKKKMLVLPKQSDMFHYRDLNQLYF